MGRPLVFALNGERVELAQADPRMTVLQYIRSQTNLQGTKLGCGEGGCGACTVILSKYSPQTKSVEEISINSCLAPLCSIDGCAITTTEGLKTSKGALHAVHQRLSGFHGSQCGFCSPGMCMSIYAGLRKSNDHSDGHGLKTVDAAQCVAGNICRCTGYRPIVDTCKSFAGDVDVEDLGLNSFWTTGKEADAARLPPYNREEDPKFPNFLIEELEARLGSSTSGENGLTFESRGHRRWLASSSLSELFPLLEEYNNANLEVKLVVGNTSSGIYKDMRPHVYIDISQIPELQAVKVADNCVQVGAAVTLSKLINLLQAESESVVYTELIKHMKQIASEQVRNRASLGGNLILAQKLGFDSDLATILLGAGAEVTLASVKGQTTMSVEEFLAKRGLEPGTVLVAITVPSWDGLSKGEKVLFKTYRASVRPNGNAVSYTNSAFLAIVDESSLIIKDLRLAFGAFGGPHGVRARNTEKLLVGKVISAALLLEAVKLVREEIKPPATVHKAVYRSSLVVGFLFEFLNSSLLSPSKGITDLTPSGKGEETETPTPDLGANFDPAIGETLNGGSQEPQVVEFGNKDSNKTSSSQRFATSKEFWPVAQPHKKVSVELQVSGEAVYVDDTPTVKGTLFATFVFNDKQPGKLVSLDASEALKVPGAIDFLTAKDIPGSNLGFTVWFWQDRLFAEDQVECVNDLVGLMVADSYEAAKEAAGKVIVNVEEQGTPIYTIEEAIARESFIESIMGDSELIIGDFPTKGEHRIEDGEVFGASQYHFSMETQAAYAIPDEDGCITVHSANQSPNATQKSIAVALGIPMNSVRVLTRRLGGAFGGKMTRAATVAVACAVAANKLKRPVKMQLDRQTNMRACPGRHEVLGRYSVDFNSDGKITSLEISVYLDCGRATDVSAVVLHAVSSSLRQYDFGSLKIITKLCKTSKVSRSIVRAPGDLQGHFLAETVIEHVASYLDIDAYKVRERNMHSLESLNKFLPDTTNSEISFTIPHLWHSLKESSRFEERRLAVDRFNEGSKWVKKGIDFVSGLYVTGTISREARVNVYEDGSVSVEVGGIEMGQGLWTKVRQSVAYGLSKLWGPDAHPLEKLSVSSVRVIQNDSLSLANSEPTGGSTGSEASCMAALLACDTLVERFKPFLQQLRQSGATPAPWEVVVGMAKFGGAALTAHGILVSDVNKGYANFGACVSEVTVDVLTGSTSIVQTDLLYDCGKSLNPAIDIGQVEGAFLMGVGYYMTEEWHEEKGKLISDGTWDYKPPTVDNIPKRFHVELSNTKANRDRILSSKASGEPPVLLAKSVHSAIRYAIMAARKDLQKIPLYEAEEKVPVLVATNPESAYFRLDVPASIDKIKELCGLYNVERYLTSLQGL